jgi:hypothetical protein
MMIKNDDQSLRLSNMKLVRIRSHDSKISKLPNDFNQLSITDRHPQTGHRNSTVAFWSKLSQILAQTVKN